MADAVVLTQEPFAGPGLADEAYQHHILRGVSRTFALTIPQLPEELRRVVGNAYLLCRIADTIEDEPAMMAADKRRLSEDFVRLVGGEGQSDAFARELGDLLSNDCLDAERDLIAHTGSVIRMTRSFNSVQRAALHRCVGIMADGMAEYQENGSPDGLRDMRELDRYCYHVAGVVGEMLTELFCDHCPQVAPHKERLMALAVSFGLGLQMTNILKDVWEDRARGACWLPRDVFHAHGFELANLPQGVGDAAFGRGIEALIGVARGHLEDALEYTLSFPARER
ncbi:MAG: phytoene synthase, partial [Gammaproteobacteria bacterium]